MNTDFPSQKTVREGAVDSVRGVEAAIELYKDPEYGTARSRLGLLLLLSIPVFRFVPRQPHSRSSLNETCRKRFFPAQRIVFNEVTYNDVDTFRSALARMNFVSRFLRRLISFNSKR